MNALKLVIIIASMLLIGGFLQNANAQHICAKHVEPPTKYPPLWRQAQIEGTVTATLTLAADGKISSIETSGGHKVLRDTTIELLRHWTFQCIGCAANTGFGHKIVFVYKLLPEPDRKGYDDSRVEMDLPEKVTITASRPTINTNDAAHP